MSEKPGKRLVGWKEYARTIGTKGANYSFAIVCACVGIGFLILGICMFVDSLSRMLISREGYRLPGELGVQHLLWSGLTTGFGLAALWRAMCRFRSGNRIEAVIPITRYNTGQLPEVETLVRASDIPPSHHQAELLRTASQGSETPAEELLRSTTNRQDE